MIEPLILGSLLHNEDYTRKVLPFLQEEYFESFESKLIYRSVNDYIKKYNNVPSKDALRFSIEESRSISEEQFKTVTDTIDGLSYDDKNDEQWLVDETEKFCQDRALYNAIRTSIGVIDDKNGKIDKGAIPKLLQDALGVSFDNSVGHDFLENVDERYEFYHRKESRIEFDIDLLNTITKGGLPRKSLNIILAGTGVGKSLAMCHFAATNLMHGKNVLYITLEMAEERIAERIDANLIDASIDEIHEMPKDVYQKKVNRLKTKTPGKLIVKEYPTASAGSGHFRHLLNELKLKKNFTPDIIYVDYLNICTSSRIKSGLNVNSYTLVKAIAEELRGLAVEFDVPLVSATQTTRSGFSNSDVGLEDTSESFGLPATADFMIALISTEELEQLGQIMVKQLKNRWGDPNMNKRFVIGIDRSRMRFYNAEQSAQDGIVNDTPVMSNSSFGARWDEEEKDATFPKKYGKNIWKASFA
jgi:archaellum biogenesis ATPase FlaH